MDLSNHYAEKWVEYPHEKGLSFLLRWYPEELRLALQKKHTKIGEGGVEIIDYVAFARDAIDHMIVDWKGMKNNGKKVKCSPGMKYKILEVAPDLNNWIATSCQLPHVFHHDIQGILKNYTGLLSTGKNGHKNKEATVVE